MTERQSDFLNKTRCLTKQRKTWSGKKKPVPKKDPTKGEFSKENLEFEQKETQKLMDEFFRSIRPVKNWRYEKAPEDFDSQPESEKEEGAEQDAEEQEENPLEEELDENTNHLKGFKFQCPVCGDNYENYLQHQQHCNPLTAKTSQKKRKRKHEDEFFIDNNELYSATCLCGVPIPVSQYLEGGQCNGCSRKKYVREKPKVHSIYSLPSVLVPIKE